MSISRHFIVLLLAVGAGACVPDSRFATPTPSPTVQPATLPPSPSAAVTPSPTPTRPALTPTGGVGLSAGQARAVAAASADLAERAGVMLESVSFLRLIADDLPSGDLGCPGPGTKPAVQPGFVSGWIIYLQVAEAQYEYHAHASQVAYCGAVPT